MNLLYSKTDIINKYKNGETLASLSREYGPCPLTIRKLLISENIPIKDNRIYQINESFFNIIDKPEKAYFLGFLYADGYISKDGRKFELALQVRDKHILELFSKTALGNRPVASKTWSSGPSANGRIQRPNAGSLLSIVCKPMVSDLVKNGCIANKSFTLKFPSYSILPFDLQSHFLRGYFDGDGSIMMKKRHGIEIGAKFTFISSIEFCRVVYELFIKNFNIQLSTEIYTKFSKPMCALGTCRKNYIEFLYNYLYKDCGEFFLTRKKEKFEECIGKIKDKQISNRVIAKTFSDALADSI